MVYIWPVSTLSKHSGASGTGKSQKCGQERKLKPSKKAKSVEAEWNAPLTVCVTLEGDCRQE